MTMPGSEIRLRRSFSARAVYAWSLQPLLVFVLVLYVIVGGTATYFAGPHVLVGALPLVVLVPLWLVGVTAGARADTLGVSWRMFARRHHSWTDVQRVELGRQGHSKFGGDGAATVGIVVEGRRHVVSPAIGIGDRRLEQFATGVSALARAAGVPVQVDPNDRYWRELLAGDLT